jgi:pimeloyl-ACP methyl ester carboxylesterase
MKQTALFKQRFFAAYCFLLLQIVLFSAACKKDAGTMLSDIIYVRHAGADMPAYIYGNVNKKVFIVVLHGGPGDNGLDYRHGRAAAELEKEYVMVYWDQRGQGLSEGKFSKQDVTINLLADDLFALLKVLKYKYGNDVKIFLLGHSWGGELGTAFLLNAHYQKEVKGWIEVDGAHDIPKVNIETAKMILKTANEQIALGNSKKEWQKMVSEVEQTDTCNITVKQGRELNKKARIAEKLMLNDGFINKPESVSLSDAAVWYRQDFLTGSLSAVNFYLLNSAFFNQIETTSYTNQLHKITLPTLLLWGKYDFIVPPALGYSAFNHIQSSEKKIVIFAESGHSPMLNQPGEFVESVTEFIEKFR